MTSLIADIPPDQPVLIAGATASGKSELALRIAESGGGVVVNADAIQVFANWRVLTARPGDADLARARHLLYGHVGADHPYSVGEWLREVAPLLSGSDRPIIVGGTGLYFSALTQGLAEIPPTPPDIRAQADQIIAAKGHEELLQALDAATLAKIDTLNPMRVQRAWEVQQSTGRGIIAWQAETGPPLLPLDQAYPVLLNADRDWLNDRINRRFQVMMQTGALAEAQANLRLWNPTAPSSKAIGALELIAHLKGDISAEEAIRLATQATRQFAKRQRTWFRARMKNWRAVDPRDLAQ